MHRFIHSQTFYVRPLQHAPTLPRHLSGIVQRGELHEFRLAQGFCLLDQFAKGKSHPRYNDRPTFHTAMPVDALFRRGQVRDAVDLVCRLLIAKKTTRSASINRHTSAGEPEAVPADAPERQMGTQRFSTSSTARTTC